MSVSGSRLGEDVCRLPGRDRLVFEGDAGGRSDEAILMPERGPDGLDRRLGVVRRCGDTPRLFLR